MARYIVINPWDGYKVKDTLYFDIWSFEERRKCYHRDCDVVQFNIHGIACVREPEDYLSLDNKPFRAYCAKHWIEILEKIHANCVEVKSDISRDSKLIQGNPGEQQYLDIVKELCQQTSYRTTRGHDCMSVFHRSMRFNLQDGFPLLTTKKMYWKGIVEELLWFISGSTNIKDLHLHDVHIWDKNYRAYNKYLSEHGRDDGHVYGDLGYVYGGQWRSYGDKTVKFRRKDAETYYELPTGGIDQLNNLIHGLKSDPTSRRHILMSWDPDLHGEDQKSKCALPPCHMMAQFYVGNETLSCCVTMRSGDMGLGVPFNIASYALLTHLIVQALDICVGELVINITDCHIYLEHRDALIEQVNRKPYPFPRLKIKNVSKETREKVFTGWRFNGKPVEEQVKFYHEKLWEMCDIDGYEFNDFELVGYDHYDEIKMEMMV